MPPLLSYWKLVVSVILLRKCAKANTNRLSSQRRLGSTAAIEAVPVRIDNPVFIVRRWRRRAITNYLSLTSEGRNGNRRKFAPYKVRPKKVRPYKVSPKRVTPYFYVFRTRGILSIWRLHKKGELRRQHTKKAISLRSLFSLGGYK